tara:strand:+ start:973 stop:1392 length:420 start_codon:yes stop_codon:yes gene_type:complete
MNLAEILLSLYSNITVIIKKSTVGQNITLSQLLCVNAIPFDGISQSDLSNSLNIEFSTLSRNLDKLLDKGLVKKKKSSNDLRLKKIYLTDKGISLNNEIIILLQKELNQFNDQIHSEEELLSVISKFNWILFKDKHSHE